MSQGGLHSLATIIKRLEAATARLEDIAESSNISGGRPQNLVSASGASAPPPPPPPPPPAAPPPVVSNEIPRSVEAYDETVIEATLKPFIEFTKTFTGPLVGEQVALLEKEFATLRSVLLMASACTKPDDKSFMEKLGPLQSGMEAIMRLKNSKRSEWDNHLAMIAEGSQAFVWVTLSPKPGPYIGEMKDSAQFYGNRVIKEYKEKDSKHVEWVRKYIAILEALRKFVIDFHTTGLVWNTKGVSISEYKVTAAVQSGTGATAPPPPPPPPPPPLPAATPSTVASGSATGVAAVFAELNRGEEVTKGLRKVDRSQMTHKNPELRASNVVPSSTGASSKKPIKPSKPAALLGKKPSKFALEGTKWVIEYHENDSTLVVDQAEINQTVSLYGCKNVTIQVKGKVNAVNLVNCTKASVVVDSVISAVSITHCTSFELQVTGSAPTIQLDSTDSGQIYLSHECLGVEITTAKCSSINVNLPLQGEEEGMFSEKAVPEMLRSVIVDGKLVTSIVEHSA